MFVVLSVERYGVVFVVFVVFVRSPSEVSSHRIGVVFVVFVVFVRSPHIELVLFLLCLWCL